MIRNTYGSIKLDGVKRNTTITGNNNTLNLDNLMGESVEIDQNRSTIKASVTGGNASSQNELRVVNRKGRLIVRKP